MSNKKLFFLIIASFSFSYILGQTQYDYEKAMEMFKNAYNKKGDQQIFDNFSSEMKAALPFDKAQGFFESLRGNYGAIKTTIFYKNLHEAFQYKLQFEKSILLMTLSLNVKTEIAGLLFKPFNESTIPEIKRNITSFQLPFKNEWTTIWGGDTKEQNYHVENLAQKNAFDWVITDANGKSFKTNGEGNEDYYAFNQPIFSPTQGEVVLAVDGIKDNPPGVQNPYFVTGNTVIIKTPNNEFVYLCHFKQFSVKVKQGDKVKEGQQLGLCGNSGNSTEPHLHFHVQNAEDMVNAIGVTCYFNNLMVNGILKRDYSPVKGDKIAPGRKR